MKKEKKRKKNCYFWRREKTEMTWKEFVWTMEREIQ